MSARPIDHVVLPVTDLRTARARLTQLGFMVADDARHPFGTENACIFLADKTYLEPLALGDHEAAEAAMRGGNQFVSRDTAFRFRNAAEGLSALVLSTSDAEADHRDFRLAGFSAGDTLTFSRLMRFPDGSEIRPTFRLAFAADLRSPDFFAFTCERVDMPAADRSLLECHPNGVTGLARVVLSESDPRAFTDFLQVVTGAGAVPAGEGRLALALANGAIEVVAPALLRDDFGVPRSAERGLRGEALVFTVADLAATERLLQDNGVRHARAGRRLLVPHEPGQGVLFVFSE